MNNPKTLLEGIENGNFKALARALTLVENDIHPSEEILLASSSFDI